MIEGFSEWLFSPSALLWLVGSVVAAMILFGTVNRRRDGLTKSLRDYVDRNQAEAKAALEAKSKRAKKSSADS